MFVNGKNKKLFLSIQIFSEKIFTFVAKQIQSIYTNGTATQIPS